MFKFSRLVFLVLISLLATACGSAGLQAQGNGQITVGNTRAPATMPIYTATPVVAPTNTRVPPTNTRVSSTAAPVQLPVTGGLEASVSNGLEGTWQVTNVLSGGLTGLGDANVASYVGKNAVITSDSISFDGQTCAEVTFARHQSTLSAFIGTDVTQLTADLGLSQGPVEVIDTTCGILGFNSFVQADPNTLVLNFNGSFMILHPS